MDWKLFAQLLVTFSVAALGWWVAHALSSRRDVANERRKMRVSYLLEAYRKLEGASNRSNESMADVESAIADIQLLGAPSQVAMAADFARKMGEAGGASLDGLLADVRKSLRGELELEPVDSGIVFLRFDDTSKNPKQHKKPASDSH